MFKTKTQQYSKILDNPVFTPALKEQIELTQEKLELTESFVAKVIRGVHKNALLQGPPGLGKSFVVLSALKAANIPNSSYEIIKGHVTASNLYKALYDHRNPGQVLVLDDCDDVFCNEKSISFIKAATDTDNPLVCYSSTRTPVINGVAVKEFLFRGTLIVCSNVVLDTGRLGRRNEAIRGITSRIPQWPMGWDTKEQKFAQVYNMVVNHDYLRADSRTRLNNQQKEDLLAYLVTHLDTIPSSKLDLRLPRHIAAEIVEGGNWKKSIAPFLKG